MSQNLVSIESFRLDVEGAAKSYASFDPTNLTPDGQPMIKILSDLVRNSREVDADYSVNWKVGLIKGGDRVIFKAKAKTADNPAASPIYDGVRVGVDFLVKDGDKWHIAESYPNNYEWGEPEWYSNDAAKTPISRFLVHMNTPTLTNIYWDLIVPTLLYSKDAATGEALSQPLPITAIAIWFQGVPNQGEPVWIGQPELYINSTSTDTEPVPDPNPDPPTKPTTTDQTPIILALSALVLGLLAYIAVK